MGKYPTEFTNMTTGFQTEKKADISSTSLFIYKIGSSNSFEERYVDLSTNQIEPSYDQGTIIQTNLNGYSAKKIILSTVPFDIYSLKNNKGEFIEIYVSNSMTRKNQANQILSTFKFIEATPSANPTL